MGAQDRFRTVGRIGWFPTRCVTGDRGSGDPGCRCGVAFLAGDGSKVQLRGYLVRRCKGGQLRRSACLL